MEFTTVKEAIKSCGFESVRAETADYFEAVIVKSSLDALTAALEAQFGPQVPPDAMTAEAQALVRPRGGVMAGQALYFVSRDGRAFFVMLWPWGDKNHITVKCGWK